MESGATMGRPPKKADQRFDKRRVVTFNEKQDKAIDEHLDETGESWMEFARAAILDKVKDDL